MTLGEKITALRKDRNYSQEDLADILKVSRQAISKWENDLAIPDIDKIVLLSRLFKCSIDYLLLDKQEEALIRNKKQATSYFDLSLFNVIKVCLMLLVPLILFFLFNNKILLEHANEGGVEFFGSSLSFYDLICSPSSCCLNIISIIILIFTIVLVPLSFLFLLKGKEIIKFIIYLAMIIYFILSVVLLILINNHNGYDAYNIAIINACIPFIYIVLFVIDLFRYKNGGLNR